MACIWILRKGTHLKAWNLGKRKLSIVCEMVNNLPGVSFYNSTWAWWLHRNGKFTTDKCNTWVLSSKLQRATLAESSRERYWGLIILRGAGRPDPKFPRTKSTPITATAARYSSHSDWWQSCSCSVVPGNQSGKLGSCHFSRKQTHHPLLLRSLAPVSKCTMSKSEGKSWNLLPVAQPQGRREQEYLQY